MSMSGERYAQQQKVWAREAHFHDDLASQLHPQCMLPQDPDPWTAALLAKVGDMSGLNVLELGCGTGDLTLHLLRAGAAVTALDISREMTEIARKRAQIFTSGRRARFITAPAEASGLPSRSFDLIVGRFALHHLDIVLAATEISRMLTSGGRALFVETSGLNPILRVARAKLLGRFGIPKFGTPDEHPLCRDDLDFLHDHFQRVDLDTPCFRFFALFDRQVMHYRYRIVSRVTSAADAFIDRMVPPLRRYSFYVVVTLSR